MTVHIPGHSRQGSAIDNEANDKEQNVQRRETHPYDGTNTTGIHILEGRWCIQIGVGLVKPFGFTGHYQGNDAANGTDNAVAETAYDRYDAKNKNSGSIGQFLPGIIKDLAGGFVDVFHMGTDFGTKDSKPLIPTERKYTKRLLNC